MKTQDRRIVAAHIDPTMPLVVVCNYLELFSDFLDQLGDENLSRSRQFADRDLYWLGDPKLVITATSMDSVEPLLHRWGYVGTQTLTPGEISQQLCLDVLRDPAAVQRLVAYAGPEQTLQMVPYANTREFFHLADTLRTEYGLTVHLPESCDPEDLWVRDMIDTKIGFRTMASQWLNGSTNLPEGYITTNLNEAVRTAYWFSRKGRSCVVKYNKGGGGVGNSFIFAEEHLSPAEIRARLEQCHGLYDQPAVIEAFVPPHQQLSPSVELFVPALGTGAPKLTYICNQVFEENGVFSGILINQKLSSSRWYAQLSEAGLCVANQLQQMGYVGFFDLDAVLDPQENLYLLEVNSRRTGGTFVDEFARYQIGEDYQDKVVLFSSSSIHSGGAANPDELLSSFSDLLFPIDDQPFGVVVTSVSTLPEGKFGAMLAAPTGEQLACLWSELDKRLSSHEIHREAIPALMHHLV